MSDTNVYEPCTRAPLGTASHLCEAVVLKSRSVPVAQVMELPSPGEGQSGQQQEAVRAVQEGDICRGGICSWKVPLPNICSNICRTGICSWKVHFPPGEGQSGQQQEAVRAV
jgi:hypothetical protein